LDKLTDARLIMQVFQHEIKQMRSPSTSSRHTPRSHATTHTRAWFQSRMWPTEVNCQRGRHGGRPGKCHPGTAPRSYRVGRSQVSEEEGAPGSQEGDHRSDKSAGPYRRQGFSGRGRGQSCQAWARPSTCSGGDPRHQDADAGF
jgi:hypothetical protein